MKNGERRDTLKGYVIPYNDSTEELYLKHSQLLRRYKNERINETK